MIDQVLALTADDASPLYGRVDADHIGVDGHSLGAATTDGVTFSRAASTTGSRRR